MSGGKSAKPGLLRIGVALFLSVALVAQIHMAMIDRSGCLNERRGEGTRLGWFETFLQALERMVNNPEITLFYLVPPLLMIVALLVCRSRPLIYVWSFLFFVPAIFEFGFGLDLNNLHECSRWGCSWCQGLLMFNFYYFVPVAIGIFVIGLVYRHNKGDPGDRPSDQGPNETA